AQQLRQRLLAAVRRQRPRPANVDAAAGHDAADDDAAAMDGLSADDGPPAVHGPATDDDAVRLPPQSVERADGELLATVHGPPAAQPVRRPGHAGRLRAHAVQHAAAIDAAADVVSAADAAAATTGHAADRPVDQGDARVAVPGPA